MLLYWYQVREIADKCLQICNLSPLSTMKIKNSLI
ncbi:hypothetical protein B6N60_02276 [Richelia sinica FACHB-800]|uniref:Uncharacterized protein n=1 Tax=Richelia sinica FACHB-800 TaxID=1357546 RepID=A0A975T7D5_9NOST|nr:hypothetical protein B6N60_02276 [Richelia sinica FACHB-800]